VPEARVPIELRWRDMDMLGHLNQAVYHELLEEGRSALFAEALGERGGFPFVVARVELDYKAEVRRDHGTVQIVARVLRVGRTSVIVEHEVVRADGVVAASGITVIVAWDPAARASRELTDVEREALSP
jgi:acyl-CoA thioester hydrolase